MDASQRFFARRMFKLAVHESSGDAYQCLFEKVMNRRHPGFVPIRPYGTEGDRKNDGYIPSTGVFFQVYAPEGPEAQRTPATAAKKAVKDFEGLKKRWNQATSIKEYCFVFNDKYLGSNVLIEDAMTEIRTRYSIQASVMLAKDLEAEAFMLDDDGIFDVLGSPVPTADLQALPLVDFTLLGQVIRHILQYAPSRSTTSNLAAPDFDEKLRFNGLSRQVASLLTSASYQTEAIRDFFSINNPTARQRLRNQLAAIYDQTRAELAASPDPEAMGDLIFFGVLEAIVPSGLPGSRALQDAALVVMAHYFEACDIFEDPNAPAR